LTTEITGSRESGGSDKLGALLSRGAAATGVMLVATVVTNSANYGYSLVMGRQLGPSLFGEFTALLGVLMILSVASQSVQTVVARFSTGIEVEMGAGAVVGFARRLTTRLTVVGALAFLVWIPFSWPLADLLQIDSAVPVIAAGSALILGFTLPVIWGALQGEQRFRELGVNMMVLAIGRFAIGVLLVLVGASVAGAIGATTMATVLALGIALPPYRGGRLPERVGPDPRVLVAYGLPTLVGLGAWTLLTNLDVVFVKSAATSTEAGYYGAAATIGKIALFLPLAFGLVIFPKAAARHVAGRDSKLLMRRVGQVVLAASVLFVIICELAGRFTVEVMFGAEFVPATELVVPLVGAMCCFALTNVMLYYYLSVHRMRFAAVLLVAVVVQIAALAVFASDPLAAAEVQLAIGLAVLVVNELAFVPLIRPLPSGGD
jgi:O-antigen/teichoic acid export membrane protein